MAGGGPDARYPLALRRGAREQARRDTGAHLPESAGIAEEKGGGTRWG